MAARPKRRLTARIGFAGGTLLLDLSVLASTGCKQKMFKATPFIDGEHEVAYGDVESRISLWPTIARVMRVAAGPGSGGSSDTTAKAEAGSSGSSSSPSGRGASRRETFPRRWLKELLGEGAGEL